MTANELSRACDRLHRLRKLARDPHTKATYEAREALAAFYSMRAHLQATGGMLFGRYVPRESRYLTRFMSEAR